MFPTTVWDVVRAAGDREPGALDQVAEEYRAPVLAFIRSRGVDGSLAEDLCHDVFIRLIAGDVLAKADSAKGRFRALLCTVTIRVIQDWSRRRREIPTAELDVAVAAPGFDRVWVVHLVERALKELKKDNPRSYDVLRRHLKDERSGAGRRGPRERSEMMSGVQGSPPVSNERSGAGRRGPRERSEMMSGVQGSPPVSNEKPDRNKLWIARRKLASLIRREIALTCRSSREIEDEIAALSPYLRPAKKLRQMEESGE